MYGEHGFDFVPAELEAARDLAAAIHRHEATLGNMLGNIDRRDHLRIEASEARIIFGWFDFIRARLEHIIPHESATVARIVTDATIAFEQACRVQGVQS